MQKELLVKRLGKEAKLPSYAHEGDAGMDLYSAEEKNILPGEIERIKTGIMVEIPEGFVGMIKDKSGLALQGIHCLAGVIDSCYRGEIEILTINHGKQEFEIKKGEKIAQMVLQPFAKAKVMEAVELSETKRGRKGFGSTGME